MSRLLTTVALLAALCTTAKAQTLTVNTFSNATHMAAATLEEEFSFPTDVSGYSQVIMRVALTCPAGGCDPWDRYAHIQLKKEGETYEIGRYITPYANGWCSWELDVTPYRELLSGDVTLLSHIETWSNGWDLSLDFEFIPGTPAWQHVDVTNLIVDYNKRYGDTVAYSNNLDAVEADIAPNAEEVWVRVAITGHGQGNHQNAAEFSPKNHKVMVGGSAVFDHFLWKDDCAANPCSPQSGTWLFSRAGWCPGQEVAPTDVDVTSQVTPGSASEFDYHLESYFNTCSPWNPDCVDGMTGCSQCTYNGGSHTEPHYKIAVQLLQFSSSAFPVGLDLPVRPVEVSIWPVPSRGFFELKADLPSALESAQLIDATGRVLLRPELEGRKFQSSIDLHGLGPGIYVLVLQGRDYTIHRQLIVQ